MLDIRAQAGVQAAQLVAQQQRTSAVPPSPTDVAAKEFESMFLSQMLSHMFEGIKTNSLFGGGEAEDVYRSLMIDQYGKSISDAGGIGVADYIKRQMLELQEVKA